MTFYRDILGCQENWRGSSDQKTLSWVNMKVPDGDNWVEFMLYDQFPDLRRLGVLHHIGMEETDVARIGRHLRGFARAQELHAAG